MAEEIRNASRIVPRTIMTSLFLNGCLGFGMLVAVLFCIGDAQAALQTPTGYPFMEIFKSAVVSTGGATAMISIIVALSLVASIGTVATSSRMYWSFARDRGLPFWQYLSKVSDPFHICSNIIL